jgi:C1A family cysteine protease
MLGLVFATAAFCTLQGDWEKFKIRYGKRYTKDEEDLRLAIFADNIRYASLLNKIDDKATYGVTKFSDLTSEEFAQRYLGYKVDDTIVNDGECYTPSSSDISGLPKSFDWRDHSGIVSPVQDQASCGSCWAFATTAVVESANAKAGKGLTKLSEQQLVDCDTSNAGCDGGNMYLAEGYVQRNGQTTEAAYPYAGVDQACKAFTPVAHISNHCLVGYSSSGDTEGKMRYHLVNEGPIVIGLNANKAQFYTGGIMSAANCNPNGVNHAVVGVAYNISGSEPYWVIRNSWGASWGEQGHFRIVYGENACGLATSASYVFA